VGSRDYSEHLVTKNVPCSISSVSHHAYVCVGINLAPTFSRRATHLLCPSGTGLKFEKACQWGIPIVNVHWLAKIVESGQVPGLDGFLVSAPTCDDAHVPDAPVASDCMVIDEEKAKDKKDLKGKGKAVDKGKGLQSISGEMLIAVNVADRMNDITNSKHFSFSIDLSFGFLCTSRYRYVSRGPSSTLCIGETQAAQTTANYDNTTARSTRNDLFWCSARCS